MIGKLNYVFFAWSSVIFLVIVITPYILVRFNKYVLKTSNKSYLSILKFFRTIHKPSGILFAISSFIHGSMVFGTVFRLHTGSILFFIVLGTVILGILFYLKKKKQLLQSHRIFAGITFLLFMLHFFNPWIL